MLLGDKLLVARKARGLSIKDLSKETFTRQEQIKAMENGRPKFDKEKLMMLVDYLGVETNKMEINRWYGYSHGLAERPYLLEKVSE